MLHFKNLFSRVLIPFKSIWYKAVVISVVISVLSVGCLVFKGLNLGIDFTGGYAVDVRILDPADVSAVASVLKSSNINDVLVQRFFGSRDVTLKVKSHSSNDISILKNALSSFYGDKLQYLGSDFIGPQFVGSQVLNSILVLLTAIVAMFFYLWLRFDALFGLGGVVSLLHDVIISLGFVSLTGLEFDLSAMAAILTIVGYSVNDSVVIYDRVRAFSANGATITEEILDSAINSTLSRTMLTSATTLMSLVPIIIFCSGSVRDFSLIVFFGIFVGTLSSIFVSAPVLLLRNYSFSFRKKHIV